MTQLQAWAVYDGWIKRGGTTYVEEPFGTETEIRFYASRKTSSPKQ